MAYAPNANTSRLQREFARILRALERTTSVRAMQTQRDDFMKHFETEELYYEGRKVYENHKAEAHRIQAQEIEFKAAELEVTCDYYMMEFM
jgi:hypothetical protein